MKTTILHLVAVSMVCLVQTPAVSASELPDGYWNLEEASEILDRTRHVDLESDLAGLSAGEKAAVTKLLLAGRLLNAVYEDSLHAEALSSLEELQLLDDGSKRTRALSDLYYLFKGPIATTPDNQRVAFLPVSPTQAGKNVYPAALSREELDVFLQQHPGQRSELLNSRTVVRANTAQNLARDLEMLARYPLLDGLHPDLRSRLEDLRSGASNPPWYALPYSVRWAPRIMDVYGLLLGAAEDVRQDDPDLAAYLGLRARDLVSDDYEGGDAAWVRGQFGNLNAQIGSYETYDDALYGVRSFFSLSVLRRDEEKSRELAAAIGDIQAIQDSLPQTQSRKVADNIPIGVYNVIADFGQSRSANTASILPNDANHARKYG
ncbi:MAG: NUDIX hydrolase, partial [Gammaproteobacteria bacterium]